MTVLNTSLLLILVLRLMSLMMLLVLARGLGGELTTRGMDNHRKLRMESLLSCCCC